MLERAIPQIDLTIRYQEHIVSDEKLLEHCILRLGLFSFPGLIITLALVAEVYPEIIPCLFLALASILGVLKELIGNRNYLPLCGALFIFLERLRSWITDRSAPGYKLQKYL